eukprot:2766901-Pyramimonas_sp.AAC.1
MEGRIKGGVRYRSSVDASEHQNPTTSEEYQRHPHGVLYSTRGAQTSRGGPEGICRSSVDAREHQNPTTSEEYQRRLPV